MRVWLRGVIGLMVMASLAAMLMGCSGGAKGTASPSDATKTPNAAESPQPAAPTATATQVVKITDTGFEPSQLVVSPGTQVTWQNVGSKAHTVAFIVDNRTLGAIEPGKTGGPVTFNTPGDYGYTDPYNELTGIITCK